MICQKCGATIGDNEASCTYCGNTIYERAEKEYFAELEELRKDLEDLEYLPQETTQKNMKGLIRSIIFILLAIGIFLLVYFLILL